MPPPVGADAAAILEEAGLSAEEVAELQAGAVVG